MKKIKYPTPTRRDNLGQLVDAGDFVAYNYSGYIAVGWVERFSKDGHTIYIRQLSPTDGHLSRVKGGPKCVLVLEKNTMGSNDGSISGPIRRAHNVDKSKRIYF